MWIWMAIGSAVLLGLYDVAKKMALRRNDVLNVLLYATAFTALFLSPFLSGGPVSWHLMLVLKAVLVTASWISGLAALKTLPLTTVSTIKAFRPVLVLLFSIIIFSEALNAAQWIGCTLAALSMFMLSRASRQEGIDWSTDRGVLLMAVSVLTGVASALYDKHILSFMEPLFVQSWCNVYITALLAITVVLRPLRGKENAHAFKWDWWIPVIAALITVADFLYFSAVHRADALLSVISMLRRGSVIVTFACGAVLFNEHNIRRKTISLFVMMTGMVFIICGSI